MQGIPLRWGFLLSTTVNMQKLHLVCCVNQNIAHQAKKRLEKSENMKKNNKKKVFCVKYINNTCISDYYPRSHAYLTISIKMLIDFS